MIDDLSITIHPQASELLFKHFASISKIFGNVLGLLEVDYIGIALLTTKSELFFISSRPNIEWTMIDHHTWLSDARFQADFFIQEQLKTWEYQQHSLKLLKGLSIPSVFDDFRVVYTFATESDDEATYSHMIKNVAMLIRIGRFCLKEILSVIKLQQKPILKLVINNEVPHENVT